MRLKQINPWIQAILFTYLSLSLPTSFALNLFDSSLDGGDQNWSGFYAGGSLGALWGSTVAAWNPLPTSFQFNAFPILYSPSNAGVTWGLLAGYNKQFLPTVVAGAEGDFSWTNTNNAFLIPWRAVSPVRLAGAYTSMRSTLNWLPSIRARLGYLFVPNFMAYGAAGIAWGNISYAANNTNNGASNQLPQYTTQTLFSETSIGYTLGAGLEWAMMPCLMLRAEYLFYQFNSAQSVVTRESTGNYPWYPSNYKWANMNANVIRGGLVFKF
jgi:outer membrane immunogenic protein